MLVATAVTSAAVHEPRGNHHGRTTQRSSRNERMEGGASADRPRSSKTLTSTWRLGRNRAQGAHLVAATSKRQAAGGRTSAVRRCKPCQVSVHRKPRRDGAPSPDAANCWPHAGTTVKLMPPKYVKPFVRSATRTTRQRRARPARKPATACASMRFVAVKSEQQLSIGSRCNRYALAAGGQLDAVDQPGSGWPFCWNAASPFHRASVEVCGPQHASEILEDAR